MTLVLLLAICFLAYSNGANDNFKGVASLFGSGTTSYRTAIAWATATTMAGSFAAIVLAQSLLMKFSGKGLVPDALVGSEYFVLAVALGASLYLALRWIRLRLGITKEWCVCIGTEQQIIPMAQPTSALVLQAAAPSVSVGKQSQCAQRYAGHFWGMGAQQLMDAAHFLSAGVDDARVGRFAGWHRDDKRTGRFPGSPQHSVVVVRHTAVCGHHWRDDL